LLETHLNLEITEKVIYIERDAMTSLERARRQRLIIHFCFFLFLFLFKLGRPRLLREFVNSRLWLLLVQWSEVDFFSVVIFIRYSVLPAVCIVMSVTRFIRPPSNNLRQPYHWRYFPA
jgi:hypothetical protein